MRILAIVMLVAGCATNDANVTVVSPIWRDSPSEEWSKIWTSEVQRSIDAWQSSVGIDCKFPISMGVNGSNIELITYKTGSVVGLYDRGTGDITVVASPPGPRGHLGTLIHELGHAEGLVHVDDESSVMYPQTGDPEKRPSEMDARSMRTAIGCD